MSQEYNTTKSRKCQHLNEAERQSIERQLNNGISKKQIARNLGRDISTIRREIKRGSVEQHVTKKYISKDPNDPGYTVVNRYCSDYAQRVYNNHRKDCHRKCSADECQDFIEFAVRKMKKDKWSPAAVVADAKRKKSFSKIVSAMTLYTWIAQGRMKVKNIDLPLKCRRSPNKRYTRKNKKILGKSIDERPKEIETRESFGHWEGDSVLGKDGNSCVRTLVERKTGNAIVLKTEAKTAEATYQALLELKTKIGKGFSSIFRSITFDNGSEFADSEKFESLGITVYYTHPYSAWERGQNEQFNGMLRRFIPKGKDISNITQEQLDCFANSLNTMPRKSRGYSAPCDLFSKEVSAIIDV